MNLEQTFMLDATKAHFIENSITLYHCLITSTLIFTIGIIGISVNTRNIIILMMSLEIMLLGLNFMFISASVFSLDPKGQLYSLLILIVAAAEAAIGLGLVVATYRVKYSIHLRYLIHLRG